MILTLLRGMFLVISALVAGLYTISLAEAATFLHRDVVITLSSALALSLFVVALDWATPRKKLSALSGVLLGLLAGMTAAYAFSFLVDFVDVVFPGGLPRELSEGVKVFSGVIFVYVAISLVLQTKDDFRFVVPYVEFAKQIRGNRPMILDTSALIDGRIADIADTRIVQGLLVVPRFVLNELQRVADSADKLKRARGRRGLDIVAKLQGDPSLEVTIHDDDTEGSTVDQKLIALADELRGRIVTTDYNLSKLADVRKVDVVNINALAEALRPVVLPGEALQVKLVKAGESPGQGVGYLEDGTMVVVEHGRDRIGGEVNLSVTSVLQTSAGRMIFGRLAEGGPDGDGRPHAAATSGEGKNGPNNRPPRRPSRTK